ncbi:MAG: hypothetical protein J6N70_08335, partial [Oribacterium sp.]|nr:hypothetical protein [Oribacterium sp.]
MKRDKTVCEAIKIVLKGKLEGMTAEQIYKAIIANKLYEFNAKNPQSVVVSTIRSSCVGVDNKFTTRDKEFIIAREIDNEIYYALNDNTDNDTYNDDNGKTSDNSVANAWLLAWNPKNYDWENVEKPFSLDTMFSRISSGGGYYDCWRCMSSKIKCGDLLYIMKLGKEPKGIFAAGYAISDSYIDDDDVRVVDVLLTKAIDFRTESIIPQQTLKDLFPNQQWSPQGSGISVNPDAAKWLIEKWDNRSEEKKDAPVIDILPSSNSEFLKYFAPLIQAIKELGGSATRKEAHEKVIELMDITEDELSVTYEKTGASRVLNQIDF